MSVKPLFLDLETTAQVLSVSASTIQALVRAGQLKPPRRISGGRVGYLLREIEEFAEGRPVSDLPPPANTAAPKKRRSISGKPASQDDPRAG